MKQKVLAVGMAAASILGYITIASANTGETARSVLDGVFTEERVLEGEELYRQNCSSCHGSGLMATDPNAADLTGPTFQYNWVGKTVHERLEKIRTTMPVGSPNSLPLESYESIVAYILDFNGIPPADPEDDHESIRENLDSIVIELPES